MAENRCRKAGSLLYVLDRSLHSGGYGKGDHVPEEESYYEEIATDLVHAESITLIGHATGKSSAVNFLSEYLKNHHLETFRRIIATETVDLSALTEPEIEEIAKKRIRAAAIPA